MNAATLSGPSDRTMTPAMRAARLLGWVSFAIGAAELIAPKRVARATGLEGREGLLRAYGAREIVAGIGVQSVNPVPALWSRVAGDMLDLGTLAVAARNDDGTRSRNAWGAIALVAGVTALDFIVATRLTRETAEGIGEKRTYGDRSGFPGGIAAARGAGITLRQSSHETRPELPDAAGGGPDRQPAGGTASGQAAAAQIEPVKASASAIPLHPDLPEEAKAVIPEPQGYTPV